MIRTSPQGAFPPRLGGKVTVIAEGRVNPGEVSGDGRSVVFGEFKPGEGESVFRWRDGQVEKLNTDGYSSFQAHSNHDASVVTYHRYSIPDATDKSGNWDIARWEDGKSKLIASSELDEMYPDIDDSGQTIVHERIDGNQGAIVRWSNGRSQDITDGEFLDLYADVSGDGRRIAFRRKFDDVYLHDQNGVTKPLPTEGNKPAGVTLDRTGARILYAAKDEDGDQDDVDDDEDRDDQ